MGTAFRDCPLKPPEAFELPLTQKAPGAWQFSQSAPEQPTLIRQHFHQQGFAYVSRANLLNIIITNGIALEIDDA